MKILDFSNQMGENPNKASSFYQIHHKTCLIFALFLFGTIFSADTSFAVGKHSRVQEPASENQEKDQKRKKYPPAELRPAAAALSLKTDDPDTETSSLSTDDHFDSDDDIKSQQLSSVQNFLGCSDLFLDSDYRDQLLEKMNLLKQENSELAKNKLKGEIEDICKKHSVLQIKTKSSPTILQSEALSLSLPLRNNPSLSIEIKLITKSSDAIQYLNALSVLSTDLMKICRRNGNFIFDEWGLLVFYDFDPKKGDFLKIATEGTSGSVLGFIYYSVYKYKYDHIPLQTSHIHRLCADERVKGLGKALIDQAGEQQDHIPPIDIIDLDTVLGSHPFYFSLGFSYVEAEAQKVAKLTQAGLAKVSSYFDQISMNRKFGNNYNLLDPIQQTRVRYQGLRSLYRDHHDCINPENSLNEEDSLENLAVFGYLLTYNQLQKHPERIPELINITKYFAKTCNFPHVSDDLNFAYKVMNIAKSFQNIELVLEILQFSQRCLSQKAVDQLMRDFF